MKTLLRISFAATSIIIVMVSIALFLFSIGTSVGTEQDQIEGMRVAGLCLVAASGVIIGWIVWGLRGAWRVVGTVPFVIFICVGLLWVLRV